MDQCSRHYIPPAVRGDLTDQQGHDLEVELEALPNAVLTRWWLGGSFPLKTVSLQGHGFAAHTAVFIQRKLLLLTPRMSSFTCFLIFNEIILIMVFIRASQKACKFPMFRAKK